MGGRVRGPFVIGEQDPYQPVLELWVADDYIVHFEIHDPNEPMAPVSQDLRQKMLNPPFGGRPGRIRLSDPGWAAEVRRALPGLDVVSGPTPELNEPLNQLIAHLEETSPASYLEDHLSAEDMAALFTAAAALHRAAPWEMLDDDQLIEVDIPELGVQGACLSVIGALGESFGMILFPSRADYQRMLEVSDEFDQTGHIDEMNFVMTSLNYERGADLPQSLRREVERYGWPVAAATAYPVVEYRGRNGVARSVTQNELRIITACAEALAAAIETHADAMDADSLPSSPLTHVDRQGIEVHLTMRPTGRTAGGIDDWPSEVETLDDTLLVRLFDYGYACWGKRFTDRVERLIRDPAEAHLMFRVGAFHLAVDGENTLAECFLDEYLETLDDPLRRLLVAHQTAWLSLWAVQRVVTGKGVELHDLLTGETLWVANAPGFHGAPDGGVLLARVVRGDGENLLSAHPTMLSLGAAVDVAERMRRYLRTRSDVAPERLRHPNSVRYLLRRWQDRIEQIHEAVRDGDR